MRRSTGCMPTQRRSRSWQGSPLQSRRGLADCHQRSVSSSERESSAGCGMTGAAIHARAKDPVGVRPGQKVVVESDTKKMLKIVSFVYLIPVILFLAGYLIMLACNTSVAVQYTAAVAGAVLGILLAIWYDRRVKARGGLSFTIVRVF